MMKDDDFKLLRGFDDRQIDEQTDICECRVAFATEKHFRFSIKIKVLNTQQTFTFGKIIFK